MAFKERKKISLKKKKKEKEKLEKGKFRES